MNRDSLIVVGVIIVVAIVLGSAYITISRGVAPSLLGTMTSGSERGSARTTMTSASGGKTQTKTNAGNGPSFSSLFLKKGKFSATYDLYKNLKKEGTASIYVKRAKESRFDLSIPQSQYITIRNDTSYITCFKQAKQSWQCFKAKEGQYPQSQGGGRPQVSDPVKEGEEFKSPIYNGTRKYAGKTCYCYYVKKQKKIMINGSEKMGSAYIEICITSDGVPGYFLSLWNSPSGKDIVRYEGVAKTILYSVPENVFNPPAQPRSLP